MKFCARGVYEYVSNIVCLCVIEGVCELDYVFDSSLVGVCNRVFLFFSWCEGV